MHVGSERTFEGSESLQILIGTTDGVLHSRCIWLETFQLNLKVQTKGLPIRDAYNRELSLNFV